MIKVKRFKIVLGFLWVSFSLCFGFFSGAVFAQSPSEEADEEELQIAKHKAHEFSIGSRGDMILNDEPELFDYLRPFVQYRFVGEGIPHWSFEIMGAYKQNRLVLKNQMNKNWAWYVRGDVEISNDGESAEVDGKEFEDLEFKAHVYRGTLGLEWKEDLGALPVHAQLMASTRYLNVYEKSDAVATFTNPDSFWESAVHLRIDTGKSLPGTELADFGFRTITNGAFFNRMQLNAWGPVAARKQIENFGRASFGARIAHRFWGPLVLVSGIQGSSTLGGVDRLNAIRSAQFAQRDESLFVSSVRAIRVASGDLGLRVYFEKEGLFAVRPFIYGVAYRELLPTNDERNDAALGGGLKLMVRLGQSVFTDLTYAFGKGNRPDLSGIHQLKYVFVARF